MYFIIVIAGLNEGHSDLRLRIRKWLVLICHFVDGLVPAGMVVKMPMEIGEMKTVVYSKVSQLERIRLRLRWGFTGQLRMLLLV